MNDWFAADDDPAPLCEGKSEATPLFDETVGTVGDDVTVEDYSCAAEPERPMNPDTPEGAAIMRLFRALKRLEGEDSPWSDGDVVGEVCSWLLRLGIDPEADDPSVIGQRLRLAARARPGSRLGAATYGIQIGTDHQNPEPIIRRALHGLATDLGPGTGIDLVSYLDEVIVRVEHNVRPTET